MKILLLSVCLAFYAFYLDGQSNSNNYKELLLMAEMDNSIVKDAKKMCIEKEMPLSIFLPDQAVLIEVITIKNNAPLYAVKTNLLDPINHGYLSTFDEIQKSFSFENANVYMGSTNKSKTTSNKRYPNSTLSGQLLLIPESTNDRVMSFSPINGSLIDADFIPSDNANLSTPISIIPLDQNNDKYLVGDQLEDAVQQYNSTGEFESTFFGNDITVLDNIRGISHNADFTSILVTVGGGANADAIAQFSLSGNNLGNFINNSSGGLNSPFDIHFREATQTYLVGGISSDQIHEYDINGNSIGTFSNINTFPEQITERTDGKVLVANFSGTEEGIILYDTDGNQESIIDNPILGGYRGVYPLQNGNLLITNGGGVYEIDYSGNLIDTKINGVSARFIHEALLPEAQEASIPTLDQWGIILLSLILLSIGIIAFRSNQNSDQNLKVISR